MAEGVIPATGDNQVRVTVRRRKGAGVVEYVDVNRVFTAICDKPRWTEGSGAQQICPTWLTDHNGQGKVVLFVVLYFLGGCDFLPAFYFLKLPQMFKYVLTTISQPGLFVKPIVEKKEGKWVLNVDECVKMLSVCYFQMHWNVFQVQYDGAKNLWEDVEGESATFVEKVRRIIFETNGPNGKKNCPDWDALRLQVARAERVLVYWQSAFMWRPTAVEFEGHGWVAVSGKNEEKLTPSNCCLRLSSHALLDQEGRVKM